MTPKLSVKEDRETSSGRWKHVCEGIKAEDMAGVGSSGESPVRGHIGVSHEELCMAWYEVWIALFIFFSLAAL